MSNATGLNQLEARMRLLQYGPNSLPEPYRPTLSSIFARQFKSPFIYVLLVAALVSFGLGQNINSVFILIVLLLNATIGTVQEYAAQKAASSLEKMVPQKATVIREGKPTVIDAAELVPGDIVLLTSGDKVPADLKLSQALTLEIDESMLTGESITTEKNATFTAKDEMHAGDRLDMAFAGTVVLRGRGRGEVLATGLKTEIGKIASDVIRHDDSPPPLMLRINIFTMRITWSMLIIIALIFVITVIRGDDLETVFLLSVALAVSAIPEGLPVAMTIALAIGMKRMAAVGVIIRKLIAVESLGSCTFIVSDKTGTLTVNELTIRRVMLADGSIYNVSGEGLNIHGVIKPEEKTKDNPDALQLLLAGGALANEATIDCKAVKQISKTDTDIDANEECTGQGDHVDLAFLVLMNKVGIGVDNARKRYTELGRIPYESQNAYSASVNRYEDRIELFAKGSVEKILSMCDRAIGVDANQLNDIERRAESLAAEGFRVLGIAHRTLDAVPDDLNSNMQQLEFIGMVAIIDPLRPEVIEAVKQCRDGGIKVAMVTGDHPATAFVLAKELGIVDENITHTDERPVLGTELKVVAKESKQAFNELITGKHIFARVEPHQKLQIVESLISNGEFVAVTGDGVNDAPALKSAHVGIAMGKRGSDVARENSDLILTDDNFFSIVQGIKQGRIVYNNIRKVIFLLISTGAAEVTLVLLSILSGLPLPLMPLQLLWLNLVTNGIQDVALVFEPEEGNELQQAPRDPNEAIFNRLMLQRVIISAITMGCIAFAVFYWQLAQGVEEDSARNITLLLMVLFENVHVFNSRSETRSIFSHKFFSNPLLLFGMLAAQAIHIAAMHIPYLNSVLNIEPVSLVLWGQLLLIALILIVVDESHKLWYGHGHHIKKSGKAI